MTEERESSIRKALSYCIEQFSTNKATSRIIEFIKDESKLSLNTSYRFQDPKFIENVLLSYRHDFGLLPKEEQDKLRFECKEWMRAIKNNENYF